jgi:class 3 adenylate cyclase
VRTINIVAAAAIVSNLVFVILFLGIGAGGLLRHLILSDLLWCVVYVAVILLNARGGGRIAAWLFLAAAWANVLIVVETFGSYRGAYLFLLLPPVLSGLFSRPGDGALPAVAIAGGVVLFAVAPVMLPDYPDTLRDTYIEPLLFTAAAVIVGLFASMVVLYFRRLADRAESALAEANARSERLLLNMLPEPIADRLKADESPIADRLNDVTVLFADLVDSTPLAETLDPDELVALLDRLFTQFDELADRFGLEKIGSIGDGYLAVAGAPVTRADHADAAARLALAMLSALGRFTVEGYGQLRMRIGLHSGPVVAGVIGRRKYRYDLWGDTVNTASRMESHGEAGRIHISATTREALGNDYVLEPRGEISVKGKGEMETFFLVRRTDAPSHPTHP